MAFTLNFGAIEASRGGNITSPDQQRLPAGMNDVSNLDKDGKPLARDDRRRLFNLGNQLWHSDSSFRAVPAKYSILSCRLPASRDGNTEFADMRAAYDALDERDEGADRAPGVRAFADLLARRARLHRTDGGGARDDSARCARAWCGPIR